MAYQIVIEKYKHKTKKKSKWDKGDNFSLEPMPWKWTLYSDKNIITYGYTHTEEQSEIASSMALGRHTNR